MKYNSIKIFNHLKIGILFLVKLNLEKENVIPLDDFDFYF